MADRRPDRRIPAAVLLGRTKGKPIGWQAESIWATAVKIMQDADVLPKTSKPSDFYTNKFYPGGAS